MQVDFSEQGIHLPELDLWLDAAVPSEVNWISHAHADHARSHHAHTIGTPLSLDIYKHRWRPTGGLHPLEFGQTIGFRGAKLTAYPASHILGAAQLLVEYQGERLVYTGDIKLRQPLCGDTTEPIRCDRIIIESTFGLPVFHFLNRDEARDRIVRFAQECLAEGTTPVFIGYALGRGQEIVHTLCSAGVPTAVHGAIAKLIPYYESAGYRFCGWVPYAMRDAEPRALVVTPDFRHVLSSRGKEFRLAYVSGWAGMENARNRTGAEMLIPYSDHGDFGELLRLIEATGAHEVDVVHGYTVPFARILCQRGYHARAPRALAFRQEEADVQETEAVEA